MWFSILTSKTAPAAGPVHITAIVTPARSLVCVASLDDGAVLSLATSPLPTDVAGVFVAAAELHAAANRRIDTRKSGRVGCLILPS